MALKYLNGVPIGGSNSTGTGNYGWASQHFKRLLYLWLKHVVGWTQVDIKGNGSWGSVGFWDYPQSAQVTNGATDASNPAILTSASATWITDGVARDDLALVIGFTDPARNGFYTVQTIDTEGQLRIQTWNGVHTDGLPLSETGLSITIYRLDGSALMPIDDDAWVMAGTGVGGTFHLRCVNDRNINYGGGWEFDISPWADWLPGTHVWASGPSRHTSPPSKAMSSDCDIGWVWGVADLDHLFVQVMFYNHDTAVRQYMSMYAGDIDHFHPGSDPRPVVIALGDGSLTQETNALNEFVRWIGADDTTEITGQLLNAVQGRDYSYHMLETNFRTRSWHTDRFVRYPILLSTRTTGYEELRGQLKSVTLGHVYGPRIFTPIGAARDQLRLGRVNIPWNGSKQLRYVY